MDINDLADKNVIKYLIEVLDWMCSKDKSAQVYEAYYETFEEFVRPYNMTKAVCVNIFEHE